MADLRVPDLNKVIIAGRLTHDPDLKYISSGRAVCRIRIANSRYYRSKDGLVKNDYASVTGGQQGDLMGGDGYCLATLEDNRWLDAEQHSLALLFGQTQRLARPPRVHV